MSRSYRQAIEMGLDIDAMVESAYLLGQLDAASLNNRHALARTRKALGRQLAACQHMAKLILAPVAFVAESDLRDTILAMRSMTTCSASTLQMLLAIYHRDFGHPVSVDRPTWNPITPAAVDELVRGIRGHSRKPGRPGTGRKKGTKP